MPGEEEILKYRLDVSDVEAKAARLNELLEQIKAKRGAGQDVSELEAQVGKELDGLGKLADKEKEAAGTTEELLKQKQKLTAVVRLLGGEFSGAVGNLGGVVELLTSMGPAAAGAAAALAALAIGGKYLVGIREDAEQAKRALDELIAARKELRDEGLAVQERVAGVFQQAGIFGGAAAGAQAVRGMMARGVEEPVATFGAVAQQIAGLTDEERRAVMAGFLASGGAAQFAGAPAEDEGMVRRLVELGRTPEAQAGLRGRIEDVGEAVRRRAIPAAGDVAWEAEQRRRETVIQEHATRAQLSEEGERLVREMVSRGLPSKRWKDVFDVGMFGDQDEIMEGTRRPVRRLLGIVAQIRGELGESEPGVGQGQVIINIDDNRQTFGTGIFNRDKRTTPGHPAWGVTVGGDNSIRTNHGM